MKYGSIVLLVSQNGNEARFKPKQGNSSQDRNFLISCVKENINIC